MKIFEQLLICIFGITLWFIPMDAVEPFRFAVLTDLHINTGRTSPTDDLRQSIQQINDTQGLDFVLVTGDLTDNGDRASLLMAKQQLDQLHIPYYVIMGNHEQKWSESACMDFKRIFGYERFKLEHKGYLFYGFSCGPLMRMALGHVAPEDIEWLKTELSQNGKNGKPVFLVTHMPMLPDDTDNWYDVTDAVRAYPVKAFIGGHYHRNVRLSYDGIPGIINVSNLRTTGETAGQYNEIDVTNDSIVVYTHPINKPRYRWTALSLSNQYYSEKPGSEDLRPDFTVNHTYPEVSEQWTVSSHAGIYSSPVVYKKQVYVADNLGRVSCYSLKDGHKKWDCQTGARILGTPDIADGIVVAASADGYVYGIRAKSGTIAWQTPVNRPSISAISIDKGIAFVGGSDSCFRAIHIKDGSVKWANHHPRGYIETKPLVIGNQVIFGAWDNTLYSLNKDDGTSQWTWQTGNGKGVMYSPAAVWPVTGFGKVFFVDPERAMTAVDLKTGQQLWRTYQSKVRESIGLSVDKKRVYAKTMQDSIVCYAADSNTPRELWASNIGFGYEHATVMLVEKDNVVFGSTKNGLIFAVDAYTGKVYWKHKIGNTLVNTVVPLSKTEILYTNEDGLIGKLSMKEQIYH